MLRAVVVNHNTSAYTELLLRSLFSKHSDGLDISITVYDNISPRITSNAESEIAREYWPVVYNSRLHPCCALVKNTPIFQRVVAEVGLSCIQYLWARGEEYYDTFRLMTQVMKTHCILIIDLFPFFD